MFILVLFDKLQFMSLISLWVTRIILIFLYLLSNFGKMF